MGLAQLALLQEPLNVKNTILLQEIRLMVNSI